MEKEKLTRIGLLVGFFVIVGALVAIGYQPAITGAGISMGRLSQHGLTTTQTITISGDITRQLCAGAYTTEAAATIANTVNTYQGGLEGMVEDALGIPSVPDVYSITAELANAINDAPSIRCLKQIGTSACGNSWSGDLLLAVYKSSNCRWDDCEYYDLKARYVGNGIDCTANLGCQFSYYYNTGETSWCW